MPSMGLLGESRNGITRGMSCWTCTVIPGSEQTLSVEAENQAEAARLKPHALAGSWKAQSLLEKHSTQVLFPKSGF